jgi:hypothetical protein
VNHLEGAAELMRQRLETGCPSESKPVRREPPWAGSIPVRLRHKAGSAEPRSFCDFYGCSWKSREKLVRSGPGLCDLLFYSRPELRASWGLWRVWSCLKQLRAGRMSATASGGGRSATALFATEYRARLIGTARRGPDDDRHPCSQRGAIYRRVPGIGPVSGRTSTRGHCRRGLLRRPHPGDRCPLRAKRWPRPLTA